MRYSKRIRHMLDNKIVKIVSATFACLTVAVAIIYGIYISQHEDVSSAAEQAAISADAAISDNVPESMRSHIIQTVDLPTAKINMFDYLVNADDTEPWSPQLTTGINANHAFVFSNVVGSYQYGLWNNWTGNNSSAAPRLDIMKPLLGTDGYPVLNLDSATWDEAWNTFVGWNYSKDESAVPPRTESMGYLFDPEFSNEQTLAYRKDYTSLNGLFTLDANGTYSFQSHDNYAWLDQASKRFHVFDTPGIYASNMGYTNGYFFPLEPLEKVFQEYGGTIFQGPADANQQLENDTPYASSTSRTNHFSSFTMEIPFYMPQGGEVINDDGKSSPMTFSFSGDDDVWIYIDDVLVGDLGGNHNEVRMNMDFKTGKIDVATATSGTTTTSWNPNFSTTIRSQFEKAYTSDKGASTIGGVEFSGETFAPETSHTLKMFYLERGNTANMSLSFNLQFPQFQQVAKVDDNGSPISGVEFDLYPLTLKDGHTINGFEASMDDFAPVDTGDTSKRVATATTDADGIGNLHDLSNESKPYDFDTQAKSGQLYYMLVERTPDGYMSAKNPTLLVYDAYDEKNNTAGTNMLLVMSRFNAGSYSSFTSYTNVKSVASYADSSTVGSGSEQIAQLISDYDKAEGVTIAVPSVKSSEDANVWLPLYGANTTGWNSVRESSYATFAERALAAVLMQAITFPREGWTLDYTKANSKMSGELSGLPDRARSYISQSDDGFLRLDYLVLNASALYDMGAYGTTPSERYGNLVKALQKRVAAGEDPTKLVSDLVAKVSPDANLIYRQDVSQTFKSMIYVGNAQNRLYLQKTDAQYNPIATPATFTIYSNATCTNELGTISTDPNNDSLIEFIFDQPVGQPSRVDGSSLHLPVTHGTYYLKESKAPEGFELNENVIELQNTPTGAHVSAGNGYDDIDVGITQLRLTSPMVQFAYDDGYYSTLTGITATLGSSAYENDEVTKQLVFDNATRRYVVAKDQGTQEISFSNPLFKTDAGTVDIAFAQDGNIHDGTDAAHATSTRYENLQGADITDLFYPVRTVYVQDTYAYGDLLIDNTVVNAPSRDSAPDRAFTYQINMKDKNDNPLSGSYEAYALTKKDAEKVAQGNGDPSKLGTATQMTFVDGVAEISLSNEQALYIMNLPRNAYFDIATSDGAFPDAKAIVRENAPGYDYTVTGVAGEDGQPTRIKSSVLSDSLVYIHLNNEYRCAYFQIEKFVHGKGANPIYPFGYELHFYTDESMSPESEITSENNSEFFAYATGGDRTGKKEGYNDTPVEPNSLGTYMVYTVAGKTSDTDDNAIIAHDDAIVTLEVPTAGKQIWVKVVEGTDPNYFVVDKDYMDGYFSDPDNVAAGVQPEDDIPENDDVIAKRTEWSTNTFKLTESSQDDLSEAPKSTYHNQVRRGTLSIKKTVQATEEEAALLQNKTFDFVISLFQDADMTIPLKLDGYDYQILKDKTEVRRGTFKNKDVVQVKMDEIISIIGLPAGSFYISNETKMPGFMPDTPQQNSHGNIDPDGDIEVPFVNKYSPRTITISKKVDLASSVTVRPNPEHEYRFILTLYTDANGTEIYNADNADENKVFYFTKSGGDQDVQWLSGNGNGATSSFTIKEGGYITFDTPTSVKSWRIEEAPDKYFDHNTAEYLSDYDDAADNGNGVYTNRIDATQQEGRRDTSLVSNIVAAPVTRPCEMVVTNVYEPEPVELPFSGMAGIASFVVLGIALMAAFVAMKVRDARNRRREYERLSDIVDQLLR